MEKNDLTVLTDLMETPRRSEREAIEFALVGERVRACGGKLVGSCGFRCARDGFI